MSERMAWGQQAYAGFWQRTGGYLIDSLIFFAIQMVLLVVVFAAAGPVVFDEAGNPTGSGPQNAISLVMVVVYFLYDTIMTSRYGWTVGKRAAGMEVRTADGDLPSFGRVVGRYFARIVSAIPLLLGFFWAGWDPKKQTWHDKMCSTFVLRRAALVPAGGPQQHLGWTGAEARAQAGQAPGWGAPGGSGWQASQPPAWAPPRESSQAPGGWSGGGRPETPSWAPGETMENARWGAQPGSGEGDRAVSGASSWPDEQPPPASGAPAAPAPPPSPQPGPQQPGPQQAGPHPAAPGPGPLPVAPGAGRGSAGGRPDPNVVAIERAGVGPDAMTWLRQVAEQVDPRLDRASTDWRSSPHAEAARACAFGILVGHLSRIYPHMEADLSRVAEVHPSFSTLLEGSRLDTLQQIAAEPARATAWLGPLIDVEDRDRIARMLE